MVKSLVTVLLPTYNEPAHIVTKSIQSITHQTYNNIEIFILDDSTNEDTQSAINRIASKDPRIKVLRSDKRMSLVEKLNLGIDRASGEYIARMDADDISYSKRFQMQIEYLTSNPDVAVLGGQIIIIDENDNSTSCRKYPTSGFALWLFSTIRSPVAHPTVMMRRSIFDNGLRYRDGAEDLDLWLRIMNLKYKINNLPDYILKYRVQDDFGNKRTADGRKPVTKARIENFSIHKPVFSVLSTVFGILQGYMPMSLLRTIYKIENRKGCYKPKTNKKY